jgi:hypothetical protein
MPTMTKQAFRFHVPPLYQGQAVEIAYMQVGDVLLRRVTDKAYGVASPKRVTYAMVVLDDDEISKIEPWNDVPATSGEWTPITERKAIDIATEGP